MKHLGILTALIPEAACLVSKPAVNRTIRVSEGISLYVCGMGPARAREGVLQLIEYGAQSILSLGTAGALAPALDAGDIILPALIIHTNGNATATSPSWHDAVTKTLSGLSVPVSNGNLLNVDKVIGSAGEKQRLYNDTGAVAIDMESAAVVAEAEQHGIPALALRVIVDTAYTVIPDAVLRNSDVYGRPRITDLAGSLFFRPGQIPRLWHLARCYRRAAARMKQLGANPEQLRCPD